MQPWWAENTYFKNIKNHTELLNSSIYLFVSKCPQTVQRNTYICIFPTLWEIKAIRSERTHEVVRCNWCGLKQILQPFVKIKEFIPNALWENLQDNLRDVTRDIQPSPDEAHTLKQTIDKDREDKFQR